jgi:heme-degrading monooxygenase HmoA
MHRKVSSSPRAALATLALLLLPACTDDEPSDTAAPVGHELTGGEVFTCSDGDLTAQPFSGPGYDAEAGAILAPVQETYLASSTLIAVKADEASMKSFLQITAPMIGQLPEQDGLVGFTVGLSSKCRYGRTITVWKTEEAMMAFVGSDAHLAAMAQGPSVSEGGVVTSWEATAAEVPVTWEVARQKVSAAKVAFGGPAP